RDPRRPRHRRPGRRSVQLRQRRLRRGPGQHLEPAAADRPASGAGTFRARRDPAARPDRPVLRPGRRPGRRRSPDQLPERLGCRRGHPLPRLRPRGRDRLRRCAAGPRAGPPATDRPGAPASLVVRPPPGADHARPPRGLGTARTGRAGRGRRHREGCMTTVTPPTYDRYPTLPLPEGETVLTGAAGWRRVRELATGRAAADAPDGRPPVVVVDTYPGVDLPELVRQISTAWPEAVIIDVEEAAAKPIAEIDARIADNLTDDRVFGVLSHLRLNEFYDTERLAALGRTATDPQAPTVLVGWGAALACPAPD